MRAGMHGAGIAIERVLTPPKLPARRFRGLLDTAFTIALGSVCAFALTLGPAPLNTVATSSATSTSFGGLDLPQSDATPSPGEARVGGSTAAHQREAAEQRVADRSVSGAPDPAPVDDAPVRDTVNPRPAPQAAPGTTRPQPLQKVVESVTQTGNALPNQIEAAAAATIAETYRAVSGLAPIIDPDACATGARHDILQLESLRILAERLTKSPLQPDPAQATEEGTGSGPVAATVYSCR